MGKVTGGFDICVELKVINFWHLDGFVAGFHLKSLSRLLLPLCHIGCAPVTDRFVEHMHSFNSGLSSLPSRSTCTISSFFFLQFLQQALLD
jgi:uncharacterized membrane protein YraQ (UPF0718 family)